MEKEFTGKTPRLKRALNLVERHHCIMFFKTQENKKKTMKYLAISVATKV